MSYCPPGALLGLVQLTGPISQQILFKITTNDAPPLQLSIGPRSTPPSLLSGNINDTTNNSCIYKNKKYDIINIQLCSPQHTGYKLPSISDNPSAEMIITCYNPSAMPEIILLCIPLYNTRTASNDEYIRAVLHHDSTQLATTTLESIFKTEQPSFGYSTCFQTQQDTTIIESHNLYVLIFPKGIYLSSKDYAVISSSVSSSTSYTVPSNITTRPIISSYTFRDGKINPTGTTDNRKMYTTQILTSSDDFQHKFEYFLYEIKSVNSGTESKKYYKTSQYKCVPFNREENLQFRKGQIYVTPGETNESLETVLKKNNIEKTREDYNVAQANIVGDNISKVIGGIIIVLAVGGICYTFTVLSKN